MSFRNLNGPFTSVTVVHKPPTQMLQSMILVQNPFILKIVNMKDSSLSGIDCSVTCQTPCLMQVFWGVSMEELDKMIHMSWLQLKKVLLRNDLQEIRCLGKNQMEELDICENNVLKIVPNQVITAADLGTLPRTRFPLVVLMLRKDCLLEDDDQKNSVVAMVTVVHIKDLVCTLSTTVIAQYLKQASEQICCLKPLYMPTDSSSYQQQYSDNVSGSTQTPAECVVCQTNPISRVLLPCRHTCVCVTCFQDSLPVLCAEESFSLIFVSKTKSHKFTQKVIENLLGQSSTGMRGGQGLMTI
ncbi:cell growth regulator with RING finger domain protein 1-like isoform X2 [Tachypleus tridentatus]|uniref:cell growth regulator with RING finger domain protein 1-like isoform X2 n=1 Tax=Tachypleus tridentatus TaxID=6853 RepID=UPI003FD6B052